MRSSKIWPLLFIFATAVNAVLFAVSFPNLRILHYCDELRRSLPTGFRTEDAQSNARSQRDKARVAQDDIGEDEAKGASLYAPLTAFVQAGTLPSWPQQAEAMRLAYVDIRSACTRIERQVGTLDTIRNALGKLSPK